MQKIKFFPTFQKLEKANIIFDNNFFPKKKIFFFKIM